MDGLVALKIYGHLRSQTTTQGSSTAPKCPTSSRHWPAEQQQSIAQEFAAPSGAGESGLAE
jgi:hypothetical protein